MYAKELVLMLRRKDYKAIRFDMAEPKKAIELPIPTSDAAINHVPNLYVYSIFNHEKIMEICNKATNIGKYDIEQSYLTQRLQCTMEQWIL